MLCKAITKKRINTSEFIEICKVEKEKSPLILSAGYQGV